MLTQHPNLRPLLFIIITLAAIVLLATGLADFELQPGQPFPFAVLGNNSASDAPDGSSSGLPSLLLSWWGLLTIMAFVGLIVLWILVFILRPQARKYLISRLVSYILLALLIYGLFNALQDRLPKLEQQPETPAMTAQPEEPLPGEATPSPPAFIANPPLWLVTSLTLVVFTLLLGLGWWMWQRQFLQQRASPVELLAREARQAVDTLRSGGNLKDTVMDCYLKMNRVLQEQRGLERPKAMTPREFERYLLEMGLQDEHIRRLTRLFESVRYGTNAPTPRDEREAVACLSAIVEAYGQP